MIGDGRSAALVADDGAVDWLCWPRFDSPALFASLLGGPENGEWSLAPEEVLSAEQTYVEGTNVLATRFRCRGGEAVVLDLLPLWPDSKPDHVPPEHELLRIARCVSGDVRMHSRMVASPEYGRVAMRWRSRRSSWIADYDGARLLARADVPQREERSAVVSQATLRAGERAAWSLSWSGEAPAVIPPMGGAAVERLERTIESWRAWSSHARFDGARRGEVVRSALVLKLLAYAPSGAIIAAPTTSLPERAGGDLNWDYRYCWLRDANMTVRALLELGYLEEANAFVSWMLHSTRRSVPRLRPLYDVFGRFPADERTLEHLAGWRGSKPVRVGNAAADQLQLDVHGEVVCSATQVHDAGMPLDGETGSLLVELGRFVCESWRTPDSGLWEPRVGPTAHTWSRVMCWAALRDLVRLGREGVLPRRAPIERFAGVAAEIERDVRTNAWHARLGHYVEPMDSSEVDAVLLRLSEVGFERPGSPRMRATVDAVREGLGVAPGRLYRYRNDLSPGEGAFALCGFWEASALALAGDLDGARAAFEGARGAANTLGLFSEEIDPESGERLGNFPQTFTHVGHVVAATRLAALERRAAARPEDGTEARP